MKTTTLLLLLFLTLTVQAEPATGGASDALLPRLSLDEVTRVVLNRSPALREALKQWEAAKQRVTQEGAWDDLKVSGTSKVRRYIDIPPNAFTDQMLSVEQAIPIFGKNRVRARIAAAEAVSAFEAVRRQQLDVIAKARASYFRLANAYAQIELNRKNYESLTQIAEINRSRYEVGTQTVGNVLVSETEASKLLEARRDLERSVAAEQSQLNVLMNRDAFAPLGSPDEVRITSAPFSINKLRALTLANRPEVGMASARIDAEKAKLRLAHRAWIPDPSLKVEGQRYNAAAQSVSELDAGISFTVPWGNVRKYSAGVSEATANVDAAQAALNRTQEEAIGFLRDALQKVETAQHHVELFRDKLVPQARQAFEANQLSYESGKASFIEWITAQRNLRDLEAEARLHLAEYQSALAELEAVVGADLKIFPLTETKPNKNRE
ncbi:MAG: TolC family protein [Verrucomicrobiota bacterium]|nr:TolC family protein [Verrucomicrobiota bacterium]